MGQFLSDTYFRSHYQIFLPSSMSLVSYFWNVLCFRRGTCQFLHVAAELQREATCGVPERLFQLRYLPEVSKAL